MSDTGIVIIGAGGHAKVVLSTLLEAGFNVLGFLDDDCRKHSEEISGFPVLGAGDILYEKKYLQAVIAIGDNRFRKEITEKYDGCCQWVTAIHPQAYVHGSVKMGNGTVVFAKSVIQPDAIIGNHVIVNTGATIDHDCNIENFVHIAPGANLAGNVRIGQGTLIGIGSVIIPGIEVGKWSTIGAGSTVITDVPDESTFVGVPAKLITGRRKK
ncbi:MAG: acetyltransferase [Bacillota bacterium]